MIYYNLCLIYKDTLQLGKKRDILPLKVPENSGTNMSVEKLLKEKVLEEHKLREMQKEEGPYQPTDDEVYAEVILSITCLLTRVDILSPLGDCRLMPPFSSVQSGDTVLHVLTSFVYNVISVISRNDRPWNISAT